jgi:HAD superfamily phosphoserine phosphatase-like hydrolase
MNKILFTDLDGTLTLKDTYTKFIFKNLQVGVVLKNLFTLLSMALKHTFKIINDDDVKKTTFGMFFRAYDTNTNIDAFVKEIPWNTLVLEQIEQKRTEGYLIIIVTASPDVYVKHICNYLGYDGFISTKTLDDEAYLTGTFDGEVCNFEQKTKRIAEFLNGKTPEHTIAYGNSSGDYAMLRFCDESYFVKKLNIKRFEK